MIKNFDAVKTQLSELASVINAFKSEAVQLRIIDLVLGAPPADDADAESEMPPEKHATNRKRKAANPRAPHRERARKAPSGAGAVSTLAQLAQSDFFSKSRTINDIIEHCKHNLVYCVSQ